MKARKTVLIGLSLFVLLVGYATNASAAIDSTGMLDNITRRFSTTVSKWESVITNAASWLFWTLVIISMVWTFGMMALRRADLREFFAEFVAFTMFTGFFWWLLDKGPEYADSIIKSLRMLAGNASRLGPDLTPSRIVDVGFDIFDKVRQQSSIWQPTDSVIGVILAAVILVILALVSVNMLFLLIASWILIYAGVFFLGFGGSKWTSDMAIGYYRTVLSVAAQLFTMVLIVGIGQAFIIDYYTTMSKGIRLSEMAVLLVAAVVLLVLVTKVPSMIGQLAFGSPGGAAGAGVGGYGAGTALGAAGMIGTAAATLGAGMMAAGAKAVGGGSALMAAVKQATGNVESGTDVTSRFFRGGGGSPGGGQGAEGGGSASGGASPFEMAAGINTISAARSQSFSERSGGSGIEASASDTEHSNGSRSDRSERSAGGGDEGAAGGSDRSSATRSEGAQVLSLRSADNGAGDSAKSSHSGPKRRPSGFTPSMGFMKKTSLVAIDTAANLATGTARVAQDKLSASVQSTLGGQIAGKIRQGRGGYDPKKEIEEFVNKSRK